MTTMASDMLTLLEAGRIALVLFPQEMGDELDLSDEEIARLRGISLDDVMEASTSNFFKLFVYIL